MSWDVSLHGGRLRFFQAAHTTSALCFLPTRWPIVEVANFLTIDQQGVHSFLGKVIDAKAAIDCFQHCLPGESRITRPGPKKMVSQVSFQFVGFGLHHFVLRLRSNLLLTSGSVRCEPLMIASNDSVCVRPAFRFRSINWSSVGPSGLPYRNRSLASSNLTSSASDISRRAFKRASWRSTWQRRARSAGIRGAKHVLIPHRSRRLA